MFIYMFFSKIGKNRMEQERLSFFNFNKYTTFNKSNE